MKKIKAFITVSIVAFIGSIIFYANLAQASNIYLIGQESILNEFDNKDSIYFETEDYEEMRVWMGKHLNAKKSILLRYNENTKKYMAVSFDKEHMENADTNICNKFKTKDYEEMKVWSTQEMDLGKHVAMRLHKDTKTYIAVSFDEKHEKACKDALDEENF